MFDIDRTPAQQIDDLWREHSVALVQFATVLVGPADANDIVVESFLRSSSIIIGGTIEHPRGYLYRAVTNQAHDWRRSRERRWQRDLAAVGPSQVGPPDTHIDVRRAVAALSLQQRAVVYLAYWEDQTEREIADSLSTATGFKRSSDGCGDLTETGG
jgi:DNA-directed RNA polymerase specialized sigma24 family protein